MKRYALAITVFIFLFTTGCKTQSVKHQTPSDTDQNINRAMELLDNAVSAHFVGEQMAMARYYNPYSGTRSDEKGSIWMYTSAIEAVNAILHSLQGHKEQGNHIFYNKNFDKYVKLLRNLYDNADYYLGTFTLTSYTQTAEWSVYGVNRGVEKGKAKVEGIENVYDDQMWLVRELLESYKITNDHYFLEKAEYLTAYVLDGWDCTIGENGSEIGGITWGPGYVSKHACSNAPMISPLVWLHEIYKDKSDLIPHRFIDPADKKTRITKEMKKSEYYLTFAEKIYDWQTQYLLRPDGVYDDMMGGCTPNKPQIEIIDGKSYRRGIICRDKVGPAITYNSGTMLSGAADLYRVTNKEKYYEDAVHLADASFNYFAKKGTEVYGYYTYDISGFRNWFNGVLLRGYKDVYPYYKNANAYIETFQQNLDYGYENFLYEGFLPTNLLTGWDNEAGKNNIEGMFSFAFAAEYALLSQLELQE